MSYVPNLYIKVIFLLASAGVGGVRVRVRVGPRPKVLFKRYTRPCRRRRSNRRRAAASMMQIYAARVCASTLYGDEDATTIRACPNVEFRKELRVNKCVFASNAFLCYVACQAFMFFPVLSLLSICGCKSVWRIESGATSPVSTV